MNTLEVDLGARSYPIHIGPGLRHVGEHLRAAITGHQDTWMASDSSLSISPSWR